MDTLADRLLARLSGAVARLRSGLADFDDATLEAPVAERLRTAQFVAATSRSTLMAIANLANGLIIVVATADGPDLGLALGWFAVLALYLSRYAAQAHARRGKPAPEVISRRTVRRLIRHIFGIALIWSAGPILLFNAGHGQQFIVATVAIGMLCGGAFALASLPTGAVAYLAPLGAGLTYAVMFGAPHPIHPLAGPLAIAYTSVLIAVAVSHGKSFARQVVAQARAELTARHDPLTGLPNRAAFDLAMADRGRDAHFYAPPAQIRTCGFPAYGSHLGCLTAKRALGQG